ncbi:MAG: endonuclease/exonuclease/phosphatase family protein [Armatimonadota bacterium]
MSGGLRLRVGTFNVENLFSRFRFSDRLPKEAILAAVEAGWEFEQTLYRPFDSEHRSLTAAAIRAIDADILAVQEVESLETLKRFNRQLLPDLGYRWMISLDGNDPRGIDVGVLSRFPIGCVRTHQYLRREDRPDEPVFARDCLEADILLPHGEALTLFVNHFKSIAEQREATMGKRRRQAAAVAARVRERFGEDPGEGSWIVLGDFNDYPPSEGLEPLLGAPWLENIVERLPAEARWTHHYAHGDEYHQLDYLLPSRAIARANPRDLPVIERRGLPLRATRAGRERFHGVGSNTPKASDHCPLVWEFTVPGTA